MAKTARKAPTRSRASEDGLDVDTALAGSRLTRLRILWLLGAALWTLLVVSLASFRSTDWPTHVVAMPTDPPAEEPAAWWATHCPTARQL